MARITWDRFYVAASDMEGWCTKCEAFTADFVEPDAENLKCPRCGRMSVLGAETAVLAGKIDVEDG